MSKIFNRLHHVCIVVRDITATEAYYESVGVGPWLDYPPLADYIELEVPSKEGFISMKYRYCNTENIQLQLCQPSPGTPQADFLEAHGEGVFHLGFEVADAKAAEAQAVDDGVDVWMRGRRTDGSGFTYFKTPEAGVTLEIRQSQK
jgi:catechol 2,3-dioxygenase-like lactoylglutathione lyase family enzyme